MISTDRDALKEGSAVSERLRAYVADLGQIDVIVFSRFGYGARTGSGVKVIPTNSRLRLLYGLDAWRVARTLPRPDVLTVQDPFETGLIALFISWMKRVPLHVQVHTDFTSDAFKQHSLLNRVRVWCAWLVLPHASGVRVVHERIKESLWARGIRVPITVLPIFVDTAAYAHLPRQTHDRFAPAFLCIGRMEAEKQFSHALEALHVARAAGFNAGLTFVGSGRLEEQLKEDARALGLESFVEFFGWQRDIRPFLARADIVLVPSRYEGYGVVGIEALASGVPVLSYDVGIAREAGALIAPPSGFSEALVRLLRDGLPKGKLEHYPYKTSEEYVERFCEDIRQAANPSSKSLQK